MIDMQSIDQAVLDYVTSKRMAVQRGWLHDEVIRQLAGSEPSSAAGIQVSHVLRTLGMLHDSTPPASKGVPCPQGKQ